MTVRYLSGFDAGFWEHMPTPNYQFEKRRRELEKKAKKEEKRRLKLEAGKSAETDVPEEGLDETLPKVEPVSE